MFLREFRRRPTRWIPGLCSKLDFGHISFDDNPGVCCADHLPYIGKKIRLLLHMAVTNWLETLKPSLRPVFATEVSLNDTLPRQVIAVCGYLLRQPHLRSLAEDADTKGRRMN